MQFQNFQILQKSWNFQKIESSNLNKIFDSLIRKEWYKNYKIPNSLLEFLDFDGSLPPHW